MQVKTISKVIRKKMEEWLETITNDSLRDKLKENILVSGGSIASMFLNEPVNDYDVYIKDMDVLCELIKYYTRGVSGVEVLDGRDKEELLDDIASNLPPILVVDDHLSARAIAVRNLKPDQIKLYFQDSNKGGKLIEEGDLFEFNKSENDPDYLPLFLSPNAISLTDDVQVVLRFSGDNEAIHKTFDYIHATNYFTFKDGLVTNKAALESLLTKQLKYQGSLYPLTSIIRMKKFIKRGWNISAGEILKIMFQISELDLKDPDVLEEQLIGVDVAYFAKLIEILRGMDAVKMTSEYLNEVIDRVFNSIDNEMED